MQILVATLRGAVHQQQRAAAYAALLPSLPCAVLALCKPGCRTVSNNGSGSGLAPAQNILAVQVWFGFT